MSQLSDFLFANWGWWHGALRKAHQFEGETRRIEDTGKRIGKPQGQSEKRGGHQFETRVPSEELHGKAEKRAEHIVVEKKTRMDCELASFLCFFLRLNLFVLAKFRMFHWPNQHIGVRGEEKRIWPVEEDKRRCPKTAHKSRSIVCSIGQ